MDRDFIEKCTTNPTAEQIEYRKKLLAQGLAILARRRNGLNASRHELLDDERAKEIDEEDLARRRRLVAAALETVWR